MSPSSGVEISGASPRQRIPEGPVRMGHKQTPMARQDLLPQRTLKGPVTGAELKILEGLFWRQVMTYLTSPSRLNKRPSMQSYAGRPVVGRQPVYSYRICSKGSTPARL